MNMEKRMQEFREDIKDMTNEQARLYGDRRTMIIRRFGEVTLRRIRKEREAGRLIVAKTIWRGGMAP